MPRAASATVAERSSPTRIQRLMPSPPVVATSSAASTFDTTARRWVYASRAVRHDLWRGGIAQQLEQERLQDPARPPGTEQPTVGDGRHDVPRTADRRQPQVRAVALGVRPHVHGAGGQPLPQADQRSARDVVGVVVLDDDRRRAGEHPGDRCRPFRRHRRAGRVLRSRLEEQRRRGPRLQGRPQPVDGQPIVVDVDADHIATHLLEQIEEWRKAGVLDDDVVTEAQHDLCHAVEGVHRAVDDRHRFGRERPGRDQLVLQRRQHGVIEVAGRQRLLADAGDDRAEVREEGRIGRTGGEVESEVPRSLGDPAVSAGASRSGRRPHVRAVATSGLDGTDVGEAPPRLADGGRRHPEPPRQFAHRGQAAADRQLAGGDQPADRRGDAPRAAIVGSTGGDLDGDVLDHGAECTVTIVLLSRYRCDITIGPHAERTDLDQRGAPTWREPCEQRCCRPIGPAPRTP